MAMVSSEEWGKLRTGIEREFSVLTDPDRVRDAMGLLDRWMEDDLFEPQRVPVVRHAEAGKFALLLESFYQFIPFGTGGRRGRVGFGPNRINEGTVALSVQGHCNYLASKREEGGAPPSVVVACDTRIFKDICGTYAFLDENLLLDLTSRKLAKIAAEIYAGCGVQCYFVQPESDEGYLSTPELSFLIRRLGADGGINVSASHNHPDDNGYKFFNVEGAQDVPPHDEELVSYMLDPGPVTRMPFARAVEAGLVKPLTPAMHAQYIEASLVVERAAQDALTKGAPPIVYTPLCGTGTTTVAEVLRAAGYNVVFHEPQAAFDGTFASIPFRLPNPEVPQAAWPAIETAEQCDSPIVLSTDPDADRLGLLVKDTDGTWIHLNGNEIGAILTYYLVHDEKRGPRRKGVVITTLVTSGVIERIARSANCAIISNLLVGFKFIADVLGSLDRTGRYEDVEGTSSDLILATEESHGFLVTPEIRDKDAAGAALVLCDVLAKLREEGRTFIDYLDEIAEACGTFGNDIRSILMMGIKGSDTLGRMMRILRTDTPKAIGGRPVVEFKDLLADSPLSSSPDWPDVRVESSDDKSKNLLVLRFDKARAIVRPSGTEPKVKVYAEVEAPGQSREQAKAMAHELATDMFRECLKLLGPEYELSRVAELIPDHVELDLKRAFDTDFTPAFVGEADALAGMESPALLEWLRERLKPYGGGSDPLQVMRPALVALCQSPQRASLSAIADKLGD